MLSSITLKLTGTCPQVSVHAHRRSIKLLWSIYKLTPSQFSQCQVPQPRETSYWIGWKLLKGVVPCLTNKFFVCPNCVFVLVVICIYCLYIFKCFIDFFGLVIPMHLFLSYDMTAQIILYTTRVPKNVLGNTFSKLWILISFKLLLLLWLVC